MTYPKEIHTTDGALEAITYNEDRGRYELAAASINGHQLPAIRYYPSDDRVAIDGPWSVNPRGSEGWGRYLGRWKKASGGSADEHERRSLIGSRIMALIREAIPTYEERRDDLLERLSWTPYGPSDIAEEVGVNRRQISDALNGHATSRPMLNHVETFLEEVEGERPSPIGKTG